MFQLFLLIGLKCSDAKIIVENAMNHNDLSNLVKNEIVSEVKNATEKDCDWDAND
jgi:hypothetical protein